MATADALFHPLRIPGQVVVDHQRTELQVDTFRPCLGGDHYLALIAEVLHQRGAGISGFGTGYPI